MSQLWSNNLLNGFIRTFCRGLLSNYHFIMLSACTVNGHVFLLDGRNDSVQNKLTSSNKSCDNLPMFQTDGHKCLFNNIATSHDIVSSCLKGQNCNKC